MPLTLPPPNRSGSKCWYAKLDLPDEDRAQVDAWMADQEIQHAQIAGALKAYGVTTGQVAGHRREHVLGKAPCL